MDLKQKLGNQPNARIVGVGQCYEGGKDGFQVTFDAADLDQTFGVLKHGWRCKEPTQNQFGELGFIKCSASYGTIDFEVDYSLPGGGAYASLAAAK